MFVNVCALVCLNAVMLSAKFVHNVTDHFDETLASAAHGTLEVEIIIDVFMFYVFYCLG
jgi:hypothetical protein